MLEDRVYKISDNSRKNNRILYWMTRELRAGNNWTLIYALQNYNPDTDSLKILVTIDETGKFHNQVQAKFVYDSSSELVRDLNELNLSVDVISGNPAEILNEYIHFNNINLMITDFNPLHIYTKVLEELKINSEVSVHTVDSHNVVPVKVVSQKQEYAARTIRPKIWNKIKDFNYSYPVISKIPLTKNESKMLVSDKIRNYTRHPGFIQGRKGALETLNSFIKTKLRFYEDLKNDPGKDFTSGLSPYLHFGFISAQEILIRLENENPGKGKDVFIEELLIRKELSDNYCTYNQHYNSIKGFPDWAIKTLEKHSADKRGFIYTLNQFENAETHDFIWNAAQNELLLTGKMHGYLRMYWAKKILEWSRNYIEAQQTTIYLNDKYSLDGIDPNGYTGINWSIGGLHDRPWFEREIFGNIRFMSVDGINRKFNMRDYLLKYQKI